MAGSRTFEIKLVGDARDAVNAFQQLGQHMSGINTKSVTLGTTLGNLLSRGLTALAGNILDAGQALFSFAGDSMKAAQESQIVDNKLTQVATSMGIFGKETGTVVARLQDYAAQTMMQIGVDDEAIKTVQTKLLTFKELAKTAGLTGGAFDRATKAAFDLASAGFGTAETNAVQLGKALQDPVKGLTSLGRAGVTFTEQEKERIKTLVESNRMGEAQAMVLAAIEKQVGGTAAASMTASQKMSLVFGELQESVGQALLPAFEVLADFVTTTVLPAFQDWWSKHAPQVKQALVDMAKWITDKAIPALQEFWKWIQEKAVPVLKEYAEYIKNDVWPTLQKFGELLGALGDAFGKSSDAAGGSADSFDTIKWIFEQLGEALDKLRTIMQFAIGQIHMLGDTVSGIITGFSAVNDVIVNFTTTLANLASQATAAVIAVVGNLYNIGRDAVTGFANGVYEVWATVNQWFGGMPGRIVTAIGSLISAATGRGREAISGLLSGIGDRWNDAAAWLSGTGSRIVNAIGGLGSTLITRGREAISGLQEGISDRWGSVSSWLGGLPRRAVDAVGDVGGKLFGAGRSLIIGFKDGVLYAVDGLIDAVTDAIGKAIQAAKDKLKINSPSRVFMEIGEGTMEGMALGIEAAAPIAARASSGAAGITASAATDLGGSSGVLSTGGGGSINVTIHAGLGTDPRELGRVVTDAIKQYERSSGPVFVAAR